jgi:diguanylate cyclase (GGDEF)-like protein
MDIYGSTQPSGGLENDPEAIRRRRLLGGAGVDPSIYDPGAGGRGPGPGAVFPSWPSHVATGAAWVPGVGRVSTDEDGAITVKAGPASRNIQVKPGRFFDELPGDPVDESTVGRHFDTLPGDPVEESAPPPDIGLAPAHGAQLAPAHGAPPRPPQVFGPTQPFRGTGASSGWDEGTIEPYHESVLHQIGRAITPPEGLPVESSQMNAIQFARKLGGVHPPIPEAGAEAAASLEASGHPYLGAATRGATSVAGSFLTPEMAVGIPAAIKGAAAITRAPRVVGAVTGLGFGGQMLYGGAKAGAQAVQDVQAGNYPAALEHGIEASQGFLGGYVAAHGAESLRGAGEEPRSASGRSDVAPGRVFATLPGEPVEEAPKAETPTPTETPGRVFSTLPGEPVHEVPPPSGFSDLPEGTVVESAPSTATPAVNVAPPSEGAPMGAPPPAAGPVAERRFQPRAEADFAGMTPEEIRRHAVEAQKAATTDHLTGLPNLLQHDLDYEKAGAQGESDLDGFKWVNDNFGHPAGNDLLVTKAKALDAAARALGTKAYRTGGDEFKVLGGSPEHVQETFRVARAVLDNGDILVRSNDGRTISIPGSALQFSHGIAEGAGEAGHRAADAALEVSKSEREAAGLRVPRGGEPPGLSEAFRRGGSQDRELPVGAAGRHEPAGSRETGGAEPAEVVPGRPGGAPTPGGELRPETHEVSASPIPPPGPRWQGDRGAMPGEPSHFLDVPRDGSFDDGKAALMEVEDDKGRAHWEAHDREGTPIGKFSSQVDAAKAAEEWVDRGRNPEARQVPEGVRVGGVDVRGAHHGQVDATVRAYDSKNNVVGYIDFRRFGREAPEIEMVEVSPEFRRKGVATALLDKLRSEYPAQEIAMAGDFATKEGKAWMASTKVGERGPEPRDAAIEDRGRATRGQFTGEAPPPSMFGNRVSRPVPKSAPPAVPAGVGDSAQATKLRALADTMQRTIDEKRNPAISNQNLTQRRATIASNMAKEADYHEETQKALNGLADAHDSRTVPPELANLKTRADVDAVLHSYAPEKFRGVRFQKTELRSLVDAVKGLRGVGDDRAMVQRLISGSGEYAADTFDSRLVDSVNALKSAAKNAGRSVRVDRYPETERFARLGFKSGEELKAAKDALREYVSPRQKTAEEIRRELERGLIGTKIPGFFPTPRPVIDEMLTRADVRPGMDVLEPSAGKGDIAEALKETGANVDTAELSGQLRGILEQKGLAPVASDFLDYTGKKYDRIVMNPPFEGGSDMAHVQHAYDLLKPGGKLVSVMSEGPFFRDDRRATEFRDWLDQVGGESEKLDQGSFTGRDAFRQTGVSSRLVTIEKPPAAEEAAAKPKTDQFGPRRPGERNNMAPPPPDANEAIPKAEPRAVPDSKALARARHNAAIDDLQFRLEQQEPVRKSSGLAMDLGYGREHVGIPAVMSNMPVELQGGGISNDVKDEIFEGLRRHDLPPQSAPAQRAWAKIAAEYLKWNTDKHVTDRTVQERLEFGENLRPGPRRARELEKARAQREEIRGGLIKKLEDIRNNATGEADVRRQMAELINASLPREARGGFLDAVRTARTTADLEGIQSKLGKALEDHMVGQLEEHANVEKKVEAARETGERRLTKAKQENAERLQALGMKQESEESVKKAIVESVKDLLPADLHSRYLNTVKDAKSPADLKSALVRIYKAAAERTLSDSIAEARAYSENASIFGLPNEHQARATAAMKAIHQLGSADSKFLSNEQKMARAEEVSGHLADLRSAISEGRTARVAEHVEEGRAISEGKPGRVFEEPKADTARPPIEPAKGDVRERFRQAGKDYGEDVKLSLTEHAAAPTRIKRIVGRFWQAAGLDRESDPERSRILKGMTAIADHNRADFLREKGREPTGIPDVGQEAADKLGADPKIAKAVASWLAHVEPALQAMREDMGHPVVFPKGKMMMNLLPLKEPRPGLLGLFERGSTSMKKEMVDEAFGTGAYESNPLKRIQAAVASHVYQADAYHLQNAIRDSGLTFEPNQTYEKSDGKDYVKMRGKEFQVEPAMLPKDDGTKELKFVPAQLEAMYREAIRRPGGETNPLTSALDVATSASLFGGAEVGGHSRRLWSRTAAAIGRSGQNALSAIPYVGSRAVAVAKALEMARDPYGETQQMSLERVGADRGTGVALHEEEAPTIGRRILHAGRNVLFGNRFGVDVLARRALGDTFDRVNLGPEFVDDLRDRVNSGKISAAQGESELAKALGPAGALEKSRYVQNIAGWNNPGTRASWINAAQYFDPFVGQRVAIPGEVKTLLNFDPHATKMALKRGEYGKAVNTLAGPLSGALGTMAAMQALNYATTKEADGKGRFTWENKQGHRLDIFVAHGKNGDWYMRNFDPVFSRASRIVGAKDAVSGKTPFSLTAALAGIPREAVNEVLSAANPLFRGLMTLTSGHIPYVTQGWNMMKTKGGFAGRAAASIPLGVAQRLGQQVGEHGASAESVKEGLAKTGAGVLGYQLYGPQDEYKKKASANSRGSFGSRYGLPRLRGASVFGRGR